MTVMLLRMFTRMHGNGDRLAPARAGDALHD